MTGLDASAPGAAIVRLNAVATAVFTCSAVLAAAMFTTPWRVQGVAVAVSLFSIGVFTFLWSFWTAVQRSRLEQIAVAQLYLLGHDVVPKGQRRSMWLALSAQVVVSLATALARSSTDGEPGSTLAFGILVPMFGLGLNGLLAARHGRFEPQHRPPQGVPPADPEMEQNASHG